jgi:hypothetical protein
MARGRQRERERVRRCEEGREGETETRRGKVLRTTTTPDRKEKTNETDRQTDLTSKF